MSDCMRSRPAMVPPGWDLFRSQDVADMRRRISTLEARLARVLEKADAWRMATRMLLSGPRKVRPAGRVWSRSRAPKERR